MLLEFTVKNFKSFTESTTFSMKKAPKQKDLEYSILHSKVKGKNVEGLCSSVIYGPNAAGKTNIISAMDVLRAILLRGNIKNTEEEKSYNFAAFNLELIPNSKLSTIEPVDFKIEFVVDKKLVNYNLSLDLGSFLDEEYSRKIISEELLVNHTLVFSRKNNFSFGDLSVINKYLLKSAKSDLKQIYDIVYNSLNKDELFLTNGFRLLISSSFVKVITDWFVNDFIIITRADAMQLVKKFSDPKKKAVYVEKTISRAAKMFGVSANKVGYLINDDEQEAKLCSFFEKKLDGNNVAVSAEVYESYGTIRFINMFPIVLRALRTGATLVIDEFDVSIHPMALMNIINVFHNDDINTNGAQLIFNTHNPIFLNKNLFRRDEIKFVEREDETNESSIYALSDFGTSGENGVRKGEDYMKGYFVSRYGAIKNIDFTSVFEDVMSQSKEV